MMKVIDLLNKIANGEEVPELVKYNGIIYNYVGINKHGVRYVDLDETDESFRYLMFNINNFNDEVEIIEGTPKKDKKIAKIGKLNQVSNNKQHLNNYILRNKINEIIDRLNGEDNE